MIRKYQIPIMKTIILPLFISILGICLFLILTLGEVGIMAHMRKMIVFTQAFPANHILTFISMIIRSFAPPILFALAGSILSLGMVSNGSGYSWPYALMLIGMNANSSENTLGNNYTSFFGASIFFFVLFTGCALLYLKKMDIHSA